MGKVDVLYLLLPFYWFQYVHPLPETLRDESWLSVADFDIEFDEFLYEIE
jgi:hypothetical protein